jgi:hypothetical protein
MAGSSFVAASLDTAPADRPPHASRSLLSESWRRSTPFAHLSPRARAAYLHEYGMHSAAADHRIGPDAFEIRSDIQAGDACETAAQLLRALIGTLEVLATTPDTSPLQQDACSGCLFLARQAAGALAVLGAGVFPAARR